jgi:hypothetical protein
MSREAVKYSFVVRDNDETKFTAIRINEGKFKDVVYFYDEIQPRELTTGELDLNFTCRVAHSPDEAFNEESEEFHKVVSDILVSVLQKGLRKEDDVDIIYRENDSESFIDQRELQSEGITISED